MLGIHSMCFRMCFPIVLPVCRCPVTAWPVCELQAGTTVYVLTIAYVTSLLPSRFDDICAIVGVIGCAFYRDLNQRAALCMLARLCLCLPLCGVQGQPWASDAC